MRDLPRLATPLGLAEDFAGVEKLSNVQFNQGWVYAVRPASTHYKKYWNPLESYFKAWPSPYLILARCWESEQQITRFLENYGTIVEDTQRTTPTRLVFRLSDFRFEQWCFSFLLELASGLRGSSSPLREVFIRRLEGTVRTVVETAFRKGRWQQVIRDIQWAVRGRETTEETSSSKAYAAALLRVLKPHLEKMSEADLVLAARSYLARAINKRIRRLRPALDFDADKGVRLYAFCDDLLDSFYWMLANDLASRRAPSACAYCRRFFFASKQNVLYCPDRPECKERGRRKLDWQRHKDKYNRSRKRKRKAGRNKQQSSHGQGHHALRG